MTIAHDDPDLGLARRQGEVLLEDHAFITALGLLERGHPHHLVGGDVPQRHPTATDQHLDAVAGLQHLPCAAKREGPVGQRKPHEDQR
jgi:hypothetical protein